MWFSITLSIHALSLTVCQSSALLQGAEEVQGKIKTAPQGDEREAAVACKKSEAAGRREMRRAGEKCDPGESARPSQHSTCPRPHLLGRRTAALHTDCCPWQVNGLQIAAFQRHEMRLCCSLQRDNLWDVNTPHGRASAQDNKAVSEAYAGVSDIGLPTQLSEAEECVEVWEPRNGCNWWELKRTHHMGLRFVGSGDRVMSPTSANEMTWSTFSSMWKVPTGFLGVPTLMCCWAL